MEDASVVVGLSDRSLLTGPAVPKFVQRRMTLQTKRLSAHVGNIQGSPEGTSTSVTYRTSRFHSLPGHDAIRPVMIQIRTTYSFPSLEQNDSFQSHHPIPQASSHKDILSDWHQDGVRAALSGKFDSLHDLVHQLVLTLWTMNDDNDLAMHLEKARVVLRSEHPSEPKTSEPGPRGEIVMQMNRLEFERLKRSAFMKPHSSNEHTAYIALGSNVDDRMALIESACKSMEDRGIKIVRTSALYETAPMYYENQQPFINGVCQIITTWKPSVLLKVLKTVERSLGREKTVENGPRPIDLDILLYDDTDVELDNLIIPHPRISEREFVLKPLCDLIPDSMPPSPRIEPTFRDRLEALTKSNPPLSPLTPLFPSPDTRLLRSEASDRQTQLMAILNLTPDSFSNDGIQSPDVSSIDPYLQRLTSAGVTILDIGGQSSRPHAPSITSEEEIARVVPTIKHIRSQPAYNNLVLSIDTYRAPVAAAALEAGANIINDISAGTLDPEMLPLMARLGCTVILMHMRGDPSTMNTLTSYPTGIINGVGTELRARVAAAEAAGVRRWRMILDPGIGFAKTAEQNLELLRRFGELRAFEGLQGIPWVVGASRKRFIGTITGVQKAEERVMGTAATVCAAVQGGADIVRVHDFGEMAEVVRMADAVWRVGPSS
ncbi:MAG: hypothetical protein Q9195_007466 [Heterodermia aff. obscurata]